ncbi:MAG: sigma-70 family RNA polymerase sigma factor [Planctomycetaceae bacterium]|nr:sigma-70 family RNA polymerase sigma factor [Planctomycetaceae bacterium]
MCDPPPLPSRPTPGELFSKHREFIYGLIHSKAQQLVRRPEFRGEAAADLAQDLICDVWARLPKYDPERAELTTFLFRVIERECADLVAKASAAKRSARKREALLETCVDARCRGAHRGIHARDDQRDADLRLDVGAVLELLSPHLQERCRQLLLQSPARLSKSRGIPIGAIRDDIARIRKHFEERGLGVYV